MFLFLDLYFTLSWKKERKEKKKEMNGNGARRNGKRNLGLGLGFQTSRINININIIHPHSKMPTCSNSKCAFLRCRLKREQKLAEDLRLQKINDDISSLSERFSKSLAIERKKKEKKNIERKKKYERKKEKKYDGN